MDFILLYLFLAIAPGTLVAAVLNLEAARLAVSIALSFAILVAIVLAGRLLHLEGGAFDALFGGVYAVIGAAGAWYLRRRASWRRVQWADGTLLIPGAVVAATAGYLLAAGPYTEVPSDGWWHIGRINDLLHEVSGGFIDPIESTRDLFDKVDGYFYIILAYLLHLTNEDVEPALGHIALVNTLLFVLGVYSFTLYVFRDMVPDRTTRHAVAAATVFFFVAHFGLGVFSYVRYYVFAPTIINYVVYLAGMACCLSFIEAGRGRYRCLAVAAVLGGVAMVVHAQEALFLATMFGAVLLVKVAGILLAGRAAGAGPGIIPPDAESRRSLLLFVGLFVAYVIFHAVAYATVTRHNPYIHDRMVDIHAYVPFLRNLYVLKPGFQFYQVVTVWGVLVYLLFLLYFRTFSRSVYITAGMILPFMTVFNPVFTDLFLRFSWPHLLWRMCYLIPLSFVAGYLLVEGCRRIKSGRGMGSRLSACAMVAVLLGLLLPINTTFFVSPYSRIYTLAPVDPGNDHRQWMDMIGYLNTIESEGVISDPVTGYVINGLTQHRYRGYKFYGERAFDVGQSSYNTHDFRRLRDRVVVINERDGKLSAAGRPGGHWPADILKVSGKYSGAFKRYVSGSPETFKELWSADRISVYRIGDW